MIVAGIDLGGDATRAAAEGQAALSVGETDRARERFEAAGDILHTKTGHLRKASDKHLTRFLAASQYYHGGHYQKAQQLARKVEARLLSPEARPLFDQFFRDVNERASASYQERITGHLKEAWQRQDYPEILTLLQEHPYVIPQASIALLRGFCFEKLHDWPAAAVFFADAFKGTPDDPAAMYYASAYPLSLVGEDNLGEAWKYAQYMLKAIPNAAAFMSASIIRFHQANAVKDNGAVGAILREQIHYFDEAWTRYQQLPPQVRNFQDLRDYMVICFEMAILGLRRLGDLGRARETCDLAIGFAPNEAGFRTIRGTLNYPSNQAIEDFREAIRLGEQQYSPYYFLGHASLALKNFAEAASWCRQALERQPSRHVTAQLYFWLAMAQQHLGARSDEVEALLARAFELDPEDQPVQRNRERIATFMTPPIVEPNREDEVNGYLPDKDYLNRRIHIQPNWEDFATVPA